MEVQGNRCAVRLWRAADVPSLVRHANNIEIARHLRDRFPHPYTRSHARAFVRHASRESAPTTFAIDVGGEAVGAIGFSPGSDVERFSAEIGYWLAESLWGRGIVTEALVMTTEYLFRRANLLRLFALPFADNPASARVLEKAGYVREGILRSSSVKYGEPKDQFLYAIVNQHWRAPDRQGP
jgi:RimJ/RimL family protein N-acetyltransferase